MPRKFPKKIKTVVIKVGSSLIATHKLRPRMAKLNSLTEQISKLRKKNINVVLVSSGAIVLGLGEFKKRTRQTDLAFLQASASVGQTRLMQIYHDLFKKSKVPCAQVLLTWDDFDNRQRFNNARQTFQALFDNHVIPIVNENDTVSTDEIRFGDNDKLSALVASMVQADLLILLSDVEGFFQKTEGKTKILREVQEITSDIRGSAKGTKKGLFAKGGMQAKIEAIHIASHAKIPSIIANGMKPKVLEKIINGERIGTFFVEKSDKMLDRKHWISFGAKSKGVLHVDAGAKKALQRGGISLLLPGISRWEGHFKAGDVVIVCDQKGAEFARGIVNFNEAALGKFTDKRGVKEVIHCDNLVLNER